MSDDDAHAALRLTLADVHRRLAERYRAAFPALADRHDAVADLLEAGGAHTSRPGFVAAYPGGANPPNDEETEMVPPGKYYCYFCEKGMCKGCVGGSCECPCPN